ncbi:hypothetical protein FKM82_014162 [Ascaphus truei]
MEGPCDCPEPDGSHQQLMMLSPVRASLAGRARRPGVTSVLSPCAVIEMQIREPFPLSAFSCLILILPPDPSFTRSLLGLACHSI